MSRKRGKGPDVIRGSRGRRALPRLSSYARVTAGIAALLANTAAWSQPPLPTGGAVAGGTATIVQPNSNTLNINQSTNKAIINWDTFSIGRGDTVNFNQPNASSSTLNRVLGSTPSWIAGTINAPGTVLLVNPNGIEITKSGVVNAGSFAASTLGIKDSDFLSGHYSFSGNGGSAGVINKGHINVSDGGFAALLGGQVANNGVISARLGFVALGAGEQATLDLSGDGFLSVAIPSSQLGNLVNNNGALVSNKGKINASGGTVFLSAATAANILRNAVNIPGSIRTNSVGVHNGRIVINGGNGNVSITGRLAANGGKRGNRGKGGKIEVSGANVALNGKVTANGKNGGTITVASAGDLNVSGKVAASGDEGQGGRIDLTGANVKVLGALIDASGTTGGGVVNIGGGARGLGPLAHAQSLSIDSTTVIRADALDRGDGGTVVAWSDGQTSVAGTFSARGGANGGNGGYVETSGKSLHVADTTQISTFAKNGKSGTWLIDPTDFTIAAVGGDMTGALLSAQLAGGNVIILSSDGHTGTNGDIFVNDTVSWSSANSLTLNAERNINVNANIAFGDGSLSLNAATGNVAINSLISVTGAGNVAIVAQPIAGVSTTGLVFGNGGSIDYGLIDHGGTFQLNGTNYTLVYSMAQLDAIDGKSAVDLSSVATYGAGLAGNYALATNFDAGSTIYTSGLITTGGATPAPPSTSFTGKLDGLGHSISNLTIASNVNNAGLIGSLGAGGVVSNIGLVNFSLTTTFAAVPAAEAYGGLVARNSGTVQTSYATGSVLGVGSVGLLVGTNNSGGTVQASYAFGTVEGSNTGALVGSNAGTVQNTYAGGLVTGAFAGGLVGRNTGTVKNSYSTTDVAGGAVGSNSGTVADVYWDSQTSGTNGGLTTNQLQGVDQISGALFSTTTNLGDTNGTVWGGGANGLYPFLKNFYPNGVQAVSGIVHTEDGSLFVPDRALGTAPVVSGVANGRSLGSEMTGANGYYYIVAPAGSIANGAGVLTYLQTNATVGTKDALRVTAAPASGTVNAVTGLDIWNGAFTIATNATLFSAGPQSAADARAANASLLALAEGGNSGVTSFVNGVTGLALITSGASFTFDTAAIASGNLIVCGAPITVNAPITLNGANTLSLLSTGPLPINAPITVTGAGTVIFNSSAITDISTTGLTFGTGASLDYGPIDHGGQFFLNGNSYSLLYTLSGGIPSGGSGFVALATDATGAAVTPELSDFNNFDGLGHTISLTGVLFNQIDNQASVSNVRLLLSGSGVLAFENFGIVQTSSASGATTAFAPLVIENFGIVQGSHSDAAVNSDAISAGGLVAENDGTVRNSYATGAVFNADPVELGGGTGGLVGTNFGLVSGSYATGAVNGAIAVGGLVGWNDGNGVVQNSYATGAVFARGATNLVDTEDWAGGLVGANFSSATINISNSYSTGAVSGNPIGQGIGGLLGFNWTNVNAGLITNSYWDTQTSGQQTSAAGTGLTTAQLQTGGLPAGFDSSLWGGATSGLYPYLKIFYPNGAQAVSGFAYSDAGATPLASGANGAVTVSALMNGTSFGRATTGANGYYYILAPAGTASSSGQAVVYSDGATGGATFQQNATFRQSGSNSSLGGLDIYGTYLKQQTTASTLSQVSNDLATALGSNSLPSYANRQIDVTASSFTIDQALNVSGTLVLTSNNGAIFQSQPIAAATLNATTTGADVQLNDVSGFNNHIASIGSVNLNGGNFYFLDSAATLPIGSVTNVNAVTIANVGGDLSTGTISAGLDLGLSAQNTISVTGALQAGGDVALTAGSDIVVDNVVLAGARATLLAGRDLTLAPNALISGQASGDAIVLSAIRNFTNNAGSGVLDTANGRWLVYSNNPAYDTFGDLDSGNRAVWNATYATLPPASVPLGGNVNGSRYVFAFQPTATFASTGTLTKTYGEDATTAVASSSYAVSGLQSGVANAFLGDTAASVFSGAPTLVSAGSAAGANVTGSPYSIAIANGTLVSLNVYIFSFANNGTLTVNPATLTYTADPATTLSGIPNPPFTGTVTGFVNNETQVTATTGTLQFSSPANASSAPGNYAINGSGLSATNYVFVQASGNATALTVKAPNNPPPNNPPPNNPTPNNPTPNNPPANDPPSQVTPPNNNPPNSGVNITFQPPGGIVPISFTPPLGNVAKTPTNNVSHESLPDGAALATNNGHAYLPISQFDPNQYSQFRLPGYEGQVGEAAVFTMIARGVDPQNAGDYLIDKFWNGTSGAWGQANAALSGKVTFSDGAGNVVDPNGNPGFPIVVGKTDLSQLLNSGPVMISDGGQPAHWMLATQMTADGKGIVANDPATGKQVVLSYDASTKTVGGVTGVFDTKTKGFISIADASGATPAGRGDLSVLQGFIPSSFIAVTVK